MARLICSQQSPHFVQTSSSESSALSVTQAPNYLPVLLLSLVSHRCGKCTVVIIRATCPFASHIHAVIQKSAFLIVASRNLRSLQDFKKPLSAQKPTVKSAPSSRKNGKRMEQSVGFFHTFFVRTINGKLNQVCAVHDVYSMAESGLPCSRDILTKLNFRMME